MNTVSDKVVMHLLAY